MDTARNLSYLVFEAVPFMERSFRFKRAGGSLIKSCLLKTCRGTCRKKRSSVLSYLATLPTQKSWRLSYKELSFKDVQRDLQKKMRSSVLSYLATLPTTTSSSRATHTATINSALVRTFATSSARTAVKKDTHLGYQKIRQKMFEYQIDNGVPIHLKGGVTDNLLFISTLALNAVGLFMCFEFFYRKAFPKKAV